MGQTMGQETERIRFLIERDGHDAARKWVRETLDSYRGAVNDPACHASTRHYKRLFEQSILEFEEWLAKDADPRP